MLHRPIYNLSDGPTALQDSGACEIENHDDDAIDRLFRTAIRYSNQPARIPRGILFPRSDTKRITMRGSTTWMDQTLELESSAIKVPKDNWPVERFGTRTSEKYRCVSTRHLPLSPPSLTLLHFSLSLSSSFSFMPLNNYIYEGGISGSYSISDGMLEAAPRSGNTEEFSREPYGTLVVHKERSMRAYTYIHIYIYSILMHGSRAGIVMLTQVWSRHARIF